MIRLAAIAGLLLCARLAHAAPALLFAHWEPDRGTPYSWFEGAKEIQSFFSQDYRAAGFIKAYIRNDGDRPLEPTDFLLNGKPLADLREQFSVIWWRLLPTPLPPGGVGEIAVRLRDPLTESASLKVTFASGEWVEATVSPSPPPVRIETVGFTQAMDHVFLVVDSIDRKPHRLKRLLIDGRPVEAKLLDPGFSSGVSPVSVRLPKPLVEGSYHTYSVEVDDLQVACCVRTYDGWVPLGTYGYGEYEEFARNGCNGYANFGRSRKGELDSQATLLMRGITIIGDSPPDDYMIGHPGLWAYYLMDEPDCQDYFHADEWPAAKKIGYHGMELERRCQVCRTLDPKKPTLLTLDLTYKPANFHIYGQLADITNPDCYPLSIGADVKMVREVVETARYGAGPHPMTFTFETYHPEPDDAAAREKQRFPRPPTVEELRLSLHYALGAGARGLYNYIHCTEKMGDSTFHGTRDYPDLWREMGRCYRSFDAVAPLLALAHPMALATCTDGKVWLRTLIAGEDALLIVAANDDYDQEKTAFRHRPREGVVIDLPGLPWLKPKAAWRVTEGGFEPLAPKPNGEGTRLDSGRLDVADLILVSSNPQLADTLSHRHTELERDRAEALLREWRRRQDRDAQVAYATRRLLGEFADRMVLGSPVGAYGVKPEGFWNPANEAYPVFEFGVNDKTEGPEQAVEWQVSIPVEAAGRAHSVYMRVGSWGRPGRFVIMGPDGKEVLAQEMHQSFGGGLARLSVTFPQAGDYRLRFEVPGTGPKGGRAARAIFVIPDDLSPPEVP